jgi:hypothetical protein
MSQSPRKLPILLTAAVAALAVFAACGGDDDDDADGPGASYAPGALICDALQQDSYEYTMDVTLEVKESESTATPEPGTVQGPAPFQFFETIVAKVEDGTEIDASVVNTDGGVARGEFQAIELGDVGYINHDEAGWEERDTAQRPLPIRYRPFWVCPALAPDINTTPLQGTAEDVNGIPSTRYTLTDLSPLFFARDPDFGGASDAANYVRAINGDIWIAQDGGYPTKLDIIGEGAYPDGKPISVHMVFEITKMGGGISVSAP